MTLSAVRTEAADGSAAGLDPVVPDTVGADSSDREPLPTGGSLDARIQHLITARDRLRKGIRKLKAEGEDALRQLAAARAETAETRLQLQSATAAFERDVAQLRAILAEQEAKSAEAMAALRAEHEAAMSLSREDLGSAQQAVRELRLELGRQQRTAYAEADAALRAEHLREVAKHRQIGKNSGVAVAMAYIEASKVEGSDLGRASELASRVLIKGAEAFGAREAELAATTGVVAA